MRATYNLRGDVRRHKVESFICAKKPTNSWSVFWLVLIRLLKTRGIEYSVGGQRGLAEGPRRGLARGPLGSQIRRQRRSTAA